MNELVIGDKVYISSKRAAEITGYAKDYVGQLCREGRVEATLVGRSWYVLETSIRAHRFGSEESSESSQTVEAESSENEALSTWEAPVYESEIAPVVPILERKSVNLLDDASETAAPMPAMNTAETVEDMQSAWREWFATREQKEESEITKPEEPEASPVAGGLEEENQVTIGRIEEPEFDPVPFTKDVVEEAVPLNRSYDIVRPNQEEPTPIQASARPQPIARREVTFTKKRSRSGAGRASVAAKAALVIISLIAISITIAGSGLIDSYVRGSGFEYTLLRAVSGVTVIE